MSRLLIMAGLTSIGTGTVHFIDTRRASFSYPLVQYDASVAAAQSAEPESGLVDASRKSDVRDGKPPSGQVGLLQFSAPGRGNEFVLSLDQSLPERLTVTADLGTPPRGGDGGSSAVGGGRGGSGAARVQAVEGSAGDLVGDGGDVTPPPVCVKYLSTIGTAAVQRVDWFPNREDALSLRRAIDAYCPISWLRNGHDVAENGGEEGVGVGEGEKRYVKRRAASGGGGRGVRRLLLYQRDQNRKIVHSGEVRNEFRLVSSLSNCNSRV